MDQLVDQNHGLYVRLVPGNRRVDTRRGLVVSGVESDAELLGR